jgi:membrane protein
VRGLAALVGVGLDTLVVVGVIRFVGRIRPRDARQRRDLWLGSLAVGVIAAGLHWAGTTVVVGSAAHNALLAPFAAIVTILVLVNFVARVLLYACAWIHLTEHPEECQRRGLPSA